MSEVPFSGPRPTRWPLNPVSVYTFFDEGDRVLYVGCTSRQYVRFQGHGGKDWWTDVAHIEVEHFEAKQDGLRRERELIARLCPLHNIAQHPERDPHLIELRRRIPSIDRMYRERKASDGDVSALYRKEAA